MNNEHFIVRATDLDGFTLDLDVYAATADDAWEDVQYGFGLKVVSVRRQHD